MVYVKVSVYDFEIPYEQECKFIALKYLMSILTKRFPESKGASSTASKELNS